MTAKRWAKRLAIGLLALTVGVAMVLMDRGFHLKKSLPQVAGTIEAAYAPGRASIIRDANAVPHISGDNDEAVYFALGVAHAQDRLWQMEMLRRVGQGRLSEIFGPATLDADKLVRTVGIPRLAEVALTHLSPDVQTALGAYAAGVNSVIADRKRPLPPEFSILFHEPEPWSPADSVILIKLLGAGLSSNAFGELTRARMIRDLPQQIIAEFERPYPDEAPVTLPDFASLYQRAPLNQAASLPIDKIGEGASNNWVIDGTRSKTGKPLLANDPHLGMTAPAIWYLAHLELESGHVVGATLPGVPAVIMGRNDHIAWGFTNTKPDTQDLYLEKPDPADPERVLGPAGSEPIERRTERIDVRFSDAVSIDIRTTPRGPILPTALSPNIEKIAGEDLLISLAWPLLMEDDRTVEAGFRLMEARNWEEFNEALRLYIAPMQNMVYADREGNIGFVAPARVPVRHPLHQTKGLTPAPAWVPENSWTGFVPFDELPRVFNPSTGYVATANNRIVEPDYPYQITLQWDLPYRAKRIEQMLNGAKKHDAKDFAAMIGDTYSPVAEKVMSLFLSMVDPATLGQRESKALALLSAWDHRMEANRPEPLIYVAWYRAFGKALYADEMGEYFERVWHFHPVLTEDVLTNQDGLAHWCDDKSSAPEETCSSLLTTSLSAAIDELTARYGSDSSQWMWGDAHRVKNNHLPFGFVPVLRGLFSLDAPSGGGFFTLNRGGHSFSSSEPYANVHAAGYRAVYDLADPDASLYMISTGQSGNPYSDHYSALLPAWTANAYIEIATDKAIYRKNAIGELVITPPRTSPGSFSG